MGPSCSKRRSFFIRQLFTAFWQVAADDLSVSVCSVRHRLAGAGCARAAGRARGRPQRSGAQFCCKEPRTTTPPVCFASTRMRGWVTWQPSSINSFTFMCVCPEVTGVSPLQERDDVWRLQTRLHAGGGTERRYPQRQGHSEARVCYGCFQG